MADVFTEYLAYLDVFEGPSVLLVACWLDVDNDLEDAKLDGPLRNFPC